MFREREIDLRAVSGGFLRFLELVNRPVEKSDDA